MPRAALATFTIFVCWAVLDFIIHGMLLAPTYLDTADLWRPQAEMKLGLMYLVNLVSAGFFVAVYALLVRPTQLGSGFRFGLLTGIGGGFSAGFGSYAVMPIPLGLAIGWSLEFLGEAVLAGLIAGAIVTSSDRKEPS
ncbi:MAG: hypothetical protein EVA65_02355 [Oceanococcus sp.]|jgi:hypothetical protein|nr:MAG: hypothetical protein EVA65_02355 [Oceanococcus sp.]